MQHNDKKIVQELLEKNIEQAFSVVIVIFGINTITVWDVATWEVWSVNIPDQYTGTVQVNSRNVLV